MPPPSSAESSQPAAELAGALLHRLQPDPPLHRHAHPDAVVDDLDVHRAAVVPTR